MDEIHKILKQYWGYEVFRPLQEDIINSVLQGKDTLALLPTGGGKSICFQVPAMVMEGLCLVVSPLISLMKDQVENLNNRNIKAVAIFSGMSRKQTYNELDRCANGYYKFLYVSPERLKTNEFRMRLGGLKICLLAIDEAHCISQWGYDFRPEYLQIAEIRTFINTPCLALTATATNRVVADIQEKLVFAKINVFKKSFERSNLSYVVLEEENKLARLLKIANRIRGTGIIYARNRKLCKDLAEYLIENGHSAGYYHAGLDNAQREEKQNLWTKSKLRIMVATNAFGMGIDKPDVRFVVHYEIPESLESYYQEAGRAGRDLLKSWCVLLYHPRDADEAMIRLKASFPPVKELKRIYELVYNYCQLAVNAGEGVSMEFEIKDFAEKYDLQPSHAYSCLLILEQFGCFSLSDAIHRPSTIIFNYDNTELYDFQIRNPNIAPLIRSILRAYGGVFDNYINIDEHTLARKLNTKKETIIVALQKLKKSGVIDYQPASNEPRINFLQDRESELVLDTTYLKSREAHALEKLEAVIHYASEKYACRSQILMEYFNDFSTKSCGQCDTCLELKKASLNEENFNYFRELLKNRLSKQPLLTNHLTDLVGKQKEHLLLQILRVLVDEGSVKTDNKGYLHWAEK